MTPKAILTSLTFLGLMACGGGSNTPVAQPQFAGNTPPDGIEDIVGLTFPLHVATLSGTNGVIGSAEKQTWSLRFASPTTAVLDGAFGRVTLTEDGDQYVGSIGDIDVSISSPSGGEYLGLIYIQYGDEIAMSGGFGFGLFGLETPTSGIEDLILADETLSYEGQGILLVEYGTDPDDTEQITGDTSLTVDFATGDVTGDLIQTATSSIDLLNGTVTGNGFTGTIGASGDLGIILGVDEASVDASFYGGAAEEVGGTFEGTGTYAASPATFSGVFAGTQP